MGSGDATVTSVSPTKAGVTAVFYIGIENGSARRVLNGKRRHDDDDAGGRSDNVAVGRRIESLAPAAEDEMDASVTRLPESQQGSTEEDGK